MEKPDFWLGSILSQSNFVLFPNVQGHTLRLLVLKEIQFEPLLAPKLWADACTHTECTLHQLSPYIGKVKSVIAQDLIQRYSSAGDLISDPFCGSGTVPLEALRMGRSVYASDLSPYAAVLTRAKLFAPPTLNEALKILEREIERFDSEAIPSELDIAPKWVRTFFHPKTLKEVRGFARQLQRQSNDFLLACLLGILHHQRPGFLSYPSSHLVPYLRDRNFPRAKFPALYRYRDFRPRMRAKLKRVYRNATDINPGLRRKFVQSSVEHVLFPERCQCILTSPPYMNALDYGRDNRLRLWLLGCSDVGHFDDGSRAAKRTFYEQAMKAFVNKAVKSLKTSGYLVMIVGESTKRSGSGHPFQVIDSMIRTSFPQLKPQSVIEDKIPNIRRARRDYRGVKREIIAVYKKR